MQKFKTALFGTGFVGRVHLEGIRRLGYVELYAIGEPQIEKAKQLADEFGVRANRGGLSPHPGRSGRRCRSHLHTQRPAFPHREGRAAGGQARHLRKAAGHQHRPGPGTGQHRQGKEAAQLHLAQPALLPDGAAHAPHGGRRRPGRHHGAPGHLLAGLAALRYRLELAPRQQVQRPLALPGRHRLALVRHGGAHHRTAHHQRLRRHGHLPQDPQAAQGPDRDLRRQDAFAGGLRRNRRSIPKTWARWCSAWATARAAPSPPAR